MEPLPLNAQVGPPGGTRHTQTMVSMHASSLVLAGGSLGAALQLSNKTSKYKQEPLGSRAGENSKYQQEPVSTGPKKRANTSRSRPWQSEEKQKNSKCKQEPFGSRSEGNQQIPAGAALGSRARKPANTSRSCSAAERGNQQVPAGAARQPSEKNNN